MNIFQEVIDELYQKQLANDIWTGHKYAFADRLKADYVGKIGELAIARIATNLGFAVEYKEDINTHEGDILISNKKIELKTATMGKNGSFQHEDLKENESDFFMLVDILPSKTYLTLIKMSDFVLRPKNKKDSKPLLYHPILQRSLTLRKGEEKKYKCTLGQKSINLGLLAGISIELKDDLSGLKQFLEKHLSS